MFWFPWFCHHKHSSTLSQRLVKKYPAVSCFPMLKGHLQQWSLCWQLSRPVVTLPPSSVKVSTYMYCDSDLTPVVEMLIWYDDIYTFEPICGSQKCKNALFFIYRCGSVAEISREEKPLQWLMLLGHLLSHLEYCPVIWSSAAERHLKKKKKKRTDSNCTD